MLVKGLDLSAQRKGNNLVPVTIYADRYHDLLMIDNIGLEDTLLQDILNHLVQRDIINLPMAKPTMYKVFNIDGYVLDNNKKLIDLVSDGLLVGQGVYLVNTTSSYQRSEDMAEIKRIYDLAARDRNYTEIMDIPHLAHNHIKRKKLVDHMRYIWHHPMEVKQQKRKALNPDWFEKTKPETDPLPCFWDKKQLPTLWSIMDAVEAAHDRHVKESSKK